MNKYYKISRIAIGVMVALISCIALVNEDISFKIFCIPLFTGIALIVSFLGMPVSKRIISIGDHMVNKCLRILYYIAFLLVLLLITISAYVLISNTYLNSTNPTLGGAIVIILLCISIFVILIVPYIQALIVLVIRMITNSNKQ